jgi:GT2 family glycosyltransferase
VTEPGDGPAPDVSVSIVNTSNRDFLLACLESLAGDRHGPVSVDVTVLDNASEDGSAGAVRARFPWARVIEQRHRAGFGANHNTVMRATEGRYVYVLNEDATVEPGSFERLVAYMDSHPEVAAVGPHIRYPDGRHQPSAWRFPSPATAALGTITLSRVGVEQSRGDEPRRVDWVMGCALLLRRQALDSVGLFDERFFIYYEDADLALRGRRNGWRVGTVRDAIAYQAPGKRQRPGAFAYLMSRNGLDYRSRVSGARGLAAGALDQARACARLMRAGVHPGRSPDARRSARGEALARAWGVAHFVRGKWGPPPRRLPGLGDVEG